jgi:nitroimidazol reductase NimA-like FMN-containing flavoprotein (pyridoxamine 5'-phosphate oxidase superfamily)
MAGERLGDERIQGYLAAKEVVVLATVGADGAPRGMAMWFLPTPDAIHMLSVADTHKVPQLRRDPRVAVVAESVGADGAISGVSVRGRVQFLEDSPERRALVERFLAKYHPRLERLWGARSMPANRVMFRIVPQHVKSWGLG